MSGSSNTMLDRFQLAGVPSLPPLILRGLKIQEQHDPDLTLADLLEVDISLYAKVLGTFFQRNLSAPFDTSSVLSLIGEDRVQALISQSALQSCFTRMSPERLKFLREHWLQSCLSASIAFDLAEKLQLENSQEAGFTARFLNLGELVMEALFADQYRLIYENSLSEAELFKAEVQRFGCSHAELSADLFTRWGQTSFSCDALRYHHEPLEQVLDASSLVKICWLANLMATQTQVGEEITLAGKGLFGIEASELAAIHASAMIKQEDNIALLHGDEDLVQAEINTQMQDTSLFQAVRPDFAGDVERPETEPLGNLLSETLSLLFGVSSALVFKCDSQTKSLTSCISTLPKDMAAELEIHCQESRSLIAKSYLSGKKVLGLEHDLNMTVVDRQILSLLGTSTMICDPVMSNDNVVGILVIGLQQSQSYLYSKQVTLLGLLKTELARGLTQTSLNDGLSPDMIYQQRISDAIHEVNNPLSIIKNYLQLFSIKQAGDDSVLEDIKIIKTEIDRVKGILANLKNNNAGQDEPVEVQINTIIENLNKVFMASIFSAKSISVRLDLDSQMPLILSKENALKQMLTNLLKNAAEALPENGSITIKSNGNIYTNERHYIQVTISDDGPGIPTSAMETLFQPGYSTKGGNHSGSGLAITKNLIENMQGQISCQSSPKGTSFTLLFPRNMDSD